MLWVTGHEANPGHTLRKSDAVVRSATWLIMILRHGSNGTLLYKSRWLMTVYDYVTDGLNANHTRLDIPLLT